MLNSKTSLEIIFALIILFSIVPQININLGNQKNISAEVYFCPEDNCTSVFVSYLMSASEIKCAFYDLNDPEIIYALKKKDANVIFDNNIKLYLNKSSFQRLNDSHTMHNKFCILNRKTVLTGSLNPTENGLNKNNNNLIIINSTEIAHNYLSNYYAICKGSQEQYKKSKLKINHQIKNINYTIKNYFCPIDNCKKQIESEISKAKKSIYFLTFSFTDKDIATILLDQKILGRDIKGVIEKRESTLSIYPNFKNYYEICLDTNPHTMHHKVFIIDNETVITGSYNPTQNAAHYNYENIIIIKNKKIVSLYLKEFEKIMNSSNCT